MNLDSAIFYSNDINKVIPFYKDTLGFKLGYQDGDRFVSFVFKNGASLGIKQKEKEQELPGAQTVIILTDGNIDDLYENLKQKGITIYKELSDQEWGKNFSILDPDNNKVEFVKR